jgi:hypothetical protein
VRRSETSQAETAVDIDHLPDAERQPAGGDGRHGAADIRRLAPAGDRSDAAARPSVRIQARGWANGPGMIWIPTAAGEALYHDLAEGDRGRPPVQSVKAHAASNPDAGT